MPVMIDVPKAYFIALFCEAIMHGIYTMIFASAMYLLLRGGWRKRTNSQKTLIGLTVFMYSLSTTHIAFSLRQSLVAFFEQHATNGGLTTFNNPGTYLLIGQTSLELVNCLLGDSIVVWRTYVLWGGGWKILVIPSTLIMTGAITGSLLVHAYATSGISATLYNGNVTLWLDIFGSVTFAANFYAICAIGYKAWQHEKAMKGLHVRGGRFHRTALVIVESGMIYCVVLLIIVALISAGNDFGVIVVIDILAHLTGIYPSLILILISAKLSFSDQVRKDNTTLATMQFNSSSQDNSSNARSLGERRLESETYPLGTFTLKYPSTGSSGEDSYHMPSKSSILSQKKGELEV